MYELGVGYSRFSSDNQDVKSANDQDTEMTEYASKNNISIIKYFRDEAKSGTKTVGRDGFFQMLDFCKQYNKDKNNTKKIKYVLVWKFNRFARNDFDSSLYKNKLKNLGIRVISITQKIEDTPEGHLLEGFLQNIDAYFSENLSVDIKRGLRNNAKEKLFNGGTPPLGYKIENKKYVIDAKEARIVKMIFDLYLKGYSLMDIAMKVNSYGYLTRFNLPFKPTSVFTILSNKKYIGVYEYKSESETFYFEDVIPAIISKEDFERVLEMRESNRKHKGTYSAKENYLLSGLIFCKDCGRNYVGMTSTRKKGNVTYRYKKYGCNGRNKLCGCKNVYVNAEALEKYAFDLLKEKLTNKDNLEAIKKEVENFIINFKKEVNYVSNDTQKELNELNIEIQNCISAIKQGLFSKELSEHLQQLENRKELLQEELCSTEFYINNKNITVEKVLEVMKKNFDSFNTMPVEEKKLFFKSYIKKIEIDHSQITFYFNLKSLGVELTPDMEPLVCLLIRWQISISDFLNLYRL